MQDVSTSVVHPRSVAGSAHAENPLQQHGYIRTYRAIVHDCGLIAAVVYGCLEDYAQMGERTGRGCVPSHKTIAKALEVSVDTIQRAMNKLRDAGYIAWEPEYEGGPNTYTLIAPGSYPTANSGIPYRNMRHNLTRVTNNTESKDSSTRVHAPAQESFLEPVSGDTKPKRKSENATKARIKTNWRPPAADIEALKENFGWTTARIDSEVFKFVNYWKGRGDARADWSAVFRSRMADVHEMEQARESRYAAMDAAKNGPVDYATDEEARKRDRRAVL